MDQQKLIQCAVRYFRIDRASKDIPQRETPQQTWKVCYSFVRKFKSDHLK